MADNSLGVIVGIDTHKEFHTVALISCTGKDIAHREFLASCDGYSKALKWAQSYGQVVIGRNRIYSLIWSRYCRVLLTVKH